MALTDYDDYVARLRENIAADFQMTSLPGSAQRFLFTSRLFAPAPPIPTASIALDRTSAHSIGPMPAVGSGRLTVLGARANTQERSGVTMVLVDMLNISGGMSGALTTPQTTNLPTAALTRFTSGEGVMAGIAVHATLGNTATTFTVSYTNQAGTAGRTSPAVAIGQTANNQAGRLITIPLEPGDTGVRSVESVTLAGTTGAAGNFGICLFKPLCAFALNDWQGAHVFDAVSSGGFFGALAEVHPDACLSVFGQVNINQGWNGSVILGEV